MSKNGKIMAYGVPQGSILGLVLSSVCKTEYFIYYSLKDLQMTAQTHSHLYRIAMKAIRQRQGQDWLRPSVEHQFIHRVKRNQRTIVILYLWCLC